MTPERVIELLDGDDLRGWASYTNIVVDRIMTPLVGRVIELVLNSGGSLDYTTVLRAVVVSAARVLVRAKAEKCLYVEPEST